MKAVREKEKKLKKEPKQKLSEYEKRQLKIKKQEKLLNTRGIPKFWTTYIIEIIYIFLIEVMVKLLLGNFALDWNLFRIFLSGCILSLIITLITTNLPSKMRKFLLVFFNFFVLFYAWLQMGFMNFLGAFMSIGNAEQGTKITDYVIEFLVAYEPAVHTLVIPFIGTILYLFFERHITRDGYIKKIEFKSLIKDVALIVYFALLVFGYYVTLEVDFMQNKFQAVSNRSLFKYPSNPSIAIKNFGTTVYFILDVKGTIMGSPEVTYTAASNKNSMEDNHRKIDDEAWESLIDKEENSTYKTLNDYFKNREVVDINSHTGLFEGKNLIMIMMESIGSVVFNEDLEEYFPTLYMMYNEGITAVNNYSPRNNCATGESELTSQTGLYSISTTCTINTYKQNEYKQALQHIMRNNGYYTSSYHNYTDYYYSRSTIEYKLGSYRFYGASDLGIDINYAYKEWPSDIELMEKALPKFINEDKFMTYMISVSAHTPYIYSSKMGDKHLNLFKDTTYTTPVKRYLSKVKELDLALEYLLEQLEEKGKLEDTVIVLFGDHYPYGLSDKEYASLADYDTKSNHEVDRTPFIIYNSETEGEKITKYITPVDYTPTLLNLFNVEYDPRMYLGNDIFSDYTDYVVFPDNSWQNAYGFYDSDKGEFIFDGEESMMEDEEIIEINKEINEKRTMSELAIKRNYFNYLFNYFEDYEELQRQKEQDALEKIIESLENRESKKESEED